MSPTATGPEQGQTASGRETRSLPDDGRRLVLASGGPVATRRRLAEALAGLDPSAVLWVGNEAPAPWTAVAAVEVHRFLGSECRLLVFDAHEGFDPDAFAAAVGTLRGGGDCIVIAPSLEEWPASGDPYLSRITPYPLTPAAMRDAFLRRQVRVWSTAPGLVRPATVDDLCPRLAPVARLSPVVSDDQARIIEQVLRVARGHARRPLLLRADRGRGKSTALGLAAARLLSDGYPRITVVAPYRRAAETLFRHACNQVGTAFSDVGDVAIGGGELRFRTAQDCLAAEADSPGLLMVDEAAAFPIAVLKAFLRRSNRLVFATTEHGYEGSGRGFGLRFAAMVKQEMPQFRQARLDDPIRWSASDPLEALVNRSLLLDAEAILPPACRDTIVERVDLGGLGDDEDRLEAVFGLLVSAHYQTRPSDLRQLLDNPQLRLWIALRGGVITGVLLGVMEGGFDAAVATDVVGGRRRPRGHLLPQSLAVHAGLDAALGLRTLRIQRIAVHPAARREGIGHQLVYAATGWAADERIDLVGCAFGVDLGLLRFWQRLDLEPARLGVRVDPASAAHTLFMLRGLSEAGGRLAATALRQFRAELPWALGGPFRDLPQDAAMALLEQGREETDNFSEVDRVTLERIAAGSRDPTTAMAVLWRWLVDALAQGDADTEMAPLVAWRLQHWPPERVCRAFGLAGARALKRLLRHRLSDWLNAPTRCG